ncbi:TRAP transporter small permease subunit [Thiocapsa roseopersicina]|uniref:TRAP transporter small permease protein n=1 Tax=Thiocapsa roseopersicina TaxID=1058 RepID=A0A1H2RNV3_THIRO|nr:TRAP transporter small permease subunit [Thiocapsa roseopersicina]SDW21142.1 TRAP-type mannitol/chloroaromatic compound transport system, small permease component [Thiocapsa roseopersicina]
MKNDPRPGGRARLLSLADRIDAVVRQIGEWATWLSLAMVLVTFAVVLLRYAFDIGSIALQESVTYMHAVLFMLGIAYTLGRNGHVRVDILYERFSRRARARVDLVGTLLLLIPVCVLIIWLGWAYVAESWRVQEASREAGGIPAVYLLKTLILIMPILLLAQGLSNALRNWLFLSGMEEALPPSDGGVSRA